MSNFYPRTHYQYTDIEKFETYEFTECIAFELATRSAKELILKIIKLTELSNTSKNDTLQEWIENSDKLQNLKKQLLDKYWLNSTYFLSSNLNYRYYYSFLQPYQCDDPIPIRHQLDKDEFAFGKASPYGNSSLDLGKVYYLDINADPHISSNTRVLQKRKKRPSLVIL